MRFLARALTGLAILAVTLGLVIYGGWRVWNAMEAQRAAEAPTPERERSFVVNAGVVELERFDPVILAYGEVRSARTLELRAATQGRLVELAPESRDGLAVEKGELLFRIDPSNALSDLERARIALDDAEAEMQEADSAIDLATRDLEAARRQVELRRSTVERQESLKERRVGTDSAVEAAELSLASAEQAVIAREQALAQARNRRIRAEIALRRQKLALADAERLLGDTEMRAPFAGILGEVSAVQGRQVGANEKLGELIDPGSLEVAIRVSNDQFARLTGPDGALVPAGVVARLPVDAAPVEARGRLDRAGARVGAAQTGRLLYASLDPAEAVLLRPGDFVTVEIEEPPLENVAVMPAAAATEEGGVFLIGEDDRLVEAEVVVLRRQGDLIAVSGAPAGARYVRERLPQLGAGLKVKPVSPEDGLQAEEMVTLEPARRDRLIAAVEAADRMPAEAKARAIERLRRDEAPLSLVERLERLEQRMAGAGGAEAAAAAEGGETVAIDAERRARLVAYVQAAQNMPSDIRQRLLTALEQPEVPRAMLERLEARIGG